jgi:regulator of protease activity HflC (stomatin/prohibitin superfamily)
MFNKFTKGAIGLGALIILVIIGYFSFTENIKPGYAGMIYSTSGGLKSDILGQGVHTVAPWQRIITYSVSTEQGYLSKDSKEGSKEDDSFSVPTKSGKLVNVDMEYSFRFDSEQLPLVFAKFKGQSGSTIEQTFMRGKLKSWAGEVTSQFEILDIYGEKRAVLNNEATKHLREKFAEFGIVIETVNFSRIDLDADTAKAVQDRITAQQQLETIKTQKELAIQNAEKAKIEAEGAAQAQIAAAEGAAKVKMTQAQAEADANMKLQASLTDKLVQYKQLEVQEAQAQAMSKWTVQTFINGGSQTPLLNLPGNK